MGDSSSASYIHMVHYLIEHCIILNLSKEECMEALSKHANIKPVITSTVWNELEKKNKEFFEAYNKKKKSPHEPSTVDTRMAELVLKSQNLNSGNDSVGVSSSGCTPYSCAHWVPGPLI